jgi:L,D-transpeptidase ErfK/SrfK
MIENKVKNKLKFKFIVLLGVLCSSSADAATYVLPSPGNDIIGSVEVVEARSGERLGDVGMRTETGYYEMQAANPNIDPYKRLSSGEDVVVPHEYILPPGPREGIVINLPEFRLYYYPPGQNIVVTFPIGIGREGVWGTPVGVTKIIKKTANPSWYPTQHVRDHAADQGTPIPDYFPPGPHNPLGSYAIYLGWPSILIHGSNLSEFIGTRISAGCIRMMNPQIKKLFNMVSIGTTVRVVNQPFKSGHKNRAVYLEAHLPLDEEQGVYNETLSSVVRIVQQEAQNPPAAVSWSAVQQIVEQATGIPQAIG